MSPESYVRHGIAIINPYGGIWTDEIFQTPDEALKYLKDFWKNNAVDISRYRLGIATLTVTLDRSPGEPVLIDLPRTDQ